ncbi:MAG: VIT and VWA domain-containing protein [Planctomycetota bacterium]
MFQTVLSAAAVAALVPAVPKGAAPQRTAPHLLVPQSRVFHGAHAPAAVRLESLDVHVELDAPLATTTLELVVSNPGARPAEAELLVPVPDGATVTAFTFEGAATAPTARVLPRDEAKAAYREIVARLIDPALLEFAGQDAVRTSVFPVPAQGTLTVTLRYESLLTSEAGRYDYVLPRSGDPASVPTTVTIDLEGAPGAVYSPTHPVVEKSAARYEVTTGPDGRLVPGDLRISLLVPEGGPLANTLFTTADPDGEGGWFLFLSADAGTHEGARDVPLREVTIVLDRSGSMAGEKFAQALEATRQVVEGLRPGESVQIIDYANDVARFAAAPVAKDADSIAQVRAYLDGLTTGGGTDLDGALGAALRQPATEGRLPLVLFLTDGLPTSGEKREASIRERARVANVHGRRVFTFGVGNDVNAPLLDAVADGSRARATYVRPGENVELAVGGVFAGLEGPLVTDLSFETLGADGAVSTRVVRDVFPRQLPDLYEGDRLLVLGRYLGNVDAATLRVRGMRDGREVGWSARADLSHEGTTHDFVRRLWAMRQIAALEDDLRSRGADPAALGALKDTPEYGETVGRILALATRHGILSDSTAFLAREGSIGLGNDELLAAACDVNYLNNRARAGSFGVSQQVNIQMNRSQGWVSCNDLAVATGSTERVHGVRQAGGRAYFANAGEWVDGRLVLGDGPIEPTRTVELGSVAYAELLDALDAEGRLKEACLAGQLVIEVAGEAVRVRPPAPPELDERAPGALDPSLHAPAYRPVPGAVVLNDTSGC